MKVTLPPSPVAGMNVILDAIRRALIPAVSQNEAAPRILLQSPSGKTYSLTVDDAGTLSTTLFTGNI